MREFPTSVAFGGRGIGVGGICERIHSHIRVHVLVGFIFFFASTFMNFTGRRKRSFRRDTELPAKEMPAHHFCLTVPLSRRRILHPYLLTRREDGGDSFPRCNFCVRCLSLLHHCIRVFSRKIPGCGEQWEAAFGPSTEHDRRVSKAD